MKTRRKMAKPKDLKGFIRNNAGIYLGSSFRIIDYPMFKGFDGLIRRVFPGAMSMDDFIEYFEKNRRYDK